MFNCVWEHALFRNRNARASSEIICCQRIFGAKNILDAALSNNFTAARACAWAEIDNVIGGPNRFFVVFNYDDRIAEIAQSPQCSEQSRVVAVVYTDARHVQNVKNTRQTGADMRRQS